MVVSSGDIVDNGSDPSEIIKAKNAFSILQNANIPYCWIVGNHDETCNDTYAYGGSGLPWYLPNYSAFDLSTAEQKNYWLSDCENGRSTAVRFQIW